jgi:chromosome segregation ATPase
LWCIDILMPSSVDALAMHSCTTCRAKERILAFAREQGLELHDTLLHDRNGIAIEDVAALLDPVFIHACNSSDNLDEARDALVAAASALENTEARTTSVTTMMAAVAAERESALAAARRDLLQLRTELADEQQGSEAMRQERQGLKTSVEQHAACMQQLQRQVERLQGSEGALAASEALAEGRIRQLAAADATIEVLHVKVADLEAVVAASKGGADELVAHVAALAAQVTQLQQQAVRMQAERDAAESAGARVVLELEEEVRMARGALVSTAEALEAAKVQGREHVAVVEGEKQHLQEALQEMEAALDERRTKVSQLSKHLESAQAGLKQAELAGVELTTASDAARGKLEQTQEEMRNVEIARVEQEDRTTKLEERLARAQNEAEDVRTAKEAVAARATDLQAQLHEAHAQQTEVRPLGVFQPWCVYSSRVVCVFVLMLSGTFQGTCSRAGAQTADAAG